uniref:Uncharacterized protein n=1 Tax=Parascaris equorum TaxID=6256 RepID=A0A914RKW9_PAREQ
MKGVEMIYSCAEDSLLLRPQMKVAVVEFPICRKEGSARNDKLLIVYKEARSDETDPRVAFAAETTTDRLVLPLLVVP